MKKNKILAGICSIAAALVSVIIMYSRGFFDTFTMKSGFNYGVLDLGLILLVLFTGIICLAGSNSDRKTVDMICAALFAAVTVVGIIQEHSIPALYVTVVISGICAIILLLGIKREMQ